MFGYFFWTEGRWPQFKTQPASVPDSAGLTPSPYWPHLQPLLASPPAPLRMERGVICEVTPIGLLKEGEGIPDGRRESYEAMPRRPEQQGTEGPALSMALCSLFLCYHVSNIPCPCLKHTMSLSQPSVTHRTCSSVTLSFSYPVPLSTLLCLPIHLTLSPYPPYPVSLSTLPCPYPVTKKVKPYSFTFFFFPLLSLLIRSRAVTTKTYFVCPP